MSAPLAASTVSVYYQQRLVCVQNLFQRSTTTTSRNGSRELKEVSSCPSLTAFTTEKASADDVTSSFPVLAATAQQHCAQKKSDNDQSMQLA